ncbi:MAG: site-specific DNA-methyltransferase [Ignavibacteriales bacterium]|nr:site-specific DNA-methyltransferase [Ignavibacteriales bacterium]
MSKHINLTKEELIKLVEKQEKELKTKKYGLVWDSEKEPEQVVLDCENNIPILKRIKNKEIQTDNTDDNILIEGDNYHALTCLNYTHKGKIDVIYIDPPYNTGKPNEWKYNDKFVDENDGYRHSKWLNMIEKRLKLARNLLSNDGVIFISIDDNEVAQLKLLCDKVFNEKNLVGIFCWKKKKKGSHLSHSFRSMSEYILCYSQNKNNLILVGETAYKDKWQPLAKRTNSKKELFFPHNTIQTKLNDGKYESGLKGKGTSSLYFKDSFVIKNGYVITDLNVEGPFVWVQKKLNEELKNGTIPALSQKFGFNVLRNDQEDKTKTPSSILDENLNIGTNEDANEELQNILGIEKSFDYPKPASLIKFLIFSKTYFYQKAIILDFFAGSGTTGHAVLELNKQDGGNRKFILCTNNENNICEEVTYPRIHNVIKGYKFQGKDKITLFEQKLTFSQLKNIDSFLEEINNVIDDNQPKFDEIEKKFEDNTIKIIGIKNIKDKKEGLGSNLQYFKTDLIPVEKITRISDKKRIELTEKAGQMIAIKENTFVELELNEWYQIFESRDKKRKTAIYFREDLDQFNTLIQKLKGTKSSLYIFSYGRIDKKQYKHLGKSISIHDIPEPILEIYKEINQTIKSK